MNLREKPRPGWRAGSQDSSPAHAPLARGPPSPRQVCGAAGWPRALSFSLFRLPRRPSDTSGGAGRGPGAACPRPYSPHLAQAPATRRGESGGRDVQHVHVSELTGPQRERQSFPCWMTRCSCPPGAVTSQAAGKSCTPRVAFSEKDPGVRSPGSSPGLSTVSSLKIGVPRPAGGRGPGTQTAA